MFETEREKGGGGGMMRKLMIEWFPLGLFYYLSIKRNDFAAVESKSFAYFFTRGFSIIQRHAIKNSDFKRAIPPPPLPLWASIICYFGANTVNPLAVFQIVKYLKKRDRAEISSVNARLLAFSSFFFFFAFRFSLNASRLIDRWLSNNKHLSWQLSQKRFTR